VAGGLDEPGEEERQNEGSDQSDGVDEEWAAAGGCELLHGAADAVEPCLPEGREPEGSEHEVEKCREEDSDGVVTDGVHSAFPTAESEFRPGCDVRNCSGWLGDGVAGRYESSALPQKSDGKGTRVASLPSEMRVFFASLRMTSKSMSDFLIEVGAA